MTRGGMARNGENGPADRNGRRDLHSPNGT
jgi:hypothetical protein